ncbi:MAG: hypothetical protein PW844_09745 [Pantoea sp.]|uniref:hypothetical protein n=1 Tax=Pantoea sp. TaxID=69393 RepID=UPI0023A5E23C|nr:hypothetical protein [Pantoea sp.]MDE1186749.1 hypothetical protein [Pantoea sp.]
MRVTSSVPQAANDTIITPNQVAPIARIDHIGNVAEIPQSASHATTSVAATTTFQTAISWQRQAAFACLLGQQTGYYLDAHDLLVEENLARSASIGHGKLQCYDVKIMATGQKFEVSTYPASAIIASGHEDRFPAIANCVNSERSRIGMVTLPSDSGQGEENFITVSFNRQGLISCAEWLERLNHQRDNCCSIEDIVSDYMTRLQGARAMLEGCSDFHKKIMTFGHSVGIKAHAYLNPTVIFLSEKPEAADGSLEVEFEPSAFFYRFLQQARIKSMTKSSGINFSCYLSPEVKSSRTYNSKADSYNLGVILQELFHININNQQHERTAFHSLIADLLEAQAKYRPDAEQTRNQLQPRYTLTSLIDEFLNTAPTNKRDEIIPPGKLTLMIQKQVNYISALYYHLAASGDEASQFLIDALVDFIVTTDMSLVGMQRYFTFSQEISGIRKPEGELTLQQRVQEMLQAKSFDSCALLFLLSDVNTTHLENCSFTDCYLDNVIGNEKPISTLKGSQIKQTPESLHKKPASVWLKDFNMERLDLTGTDTAPIRWLVQSLGHTTVIGNKWENVHIYLNQCNKADNAEINFNQSQLKNVVMSSLPVNIHHQQHHYYPCCEILQSNFSNVEAENLTWTGLTFRRGCNFSGLRVKNLIVKNTRFNDTLFGNYDKRQITLAAEMFNNHQIRSQLEPGTGEGGKPEFLLFLESIADQRVKQDFAEQMASHIIAGGGERLSHPALYALLNHFSQQGYASSIDIQHCCEWAMDKLYSALGTQLLDQRISIEEQHHILTRYLPVLGNNALLKYQLWIHQRYNQLPPAVKTAFLTIPEIAAVQRELIKLMVVDSDDGQQLPIYVLPDKTKGFYLTNEHQDAVLEKRTDIVINPEPFDIEQQDKTLSVSFIGKNAARINEIFSLYPWLFIQQQPAVRPVFDPFQFTAPVSGREAARLELISRNFQRCVAKNGVWQIDLTSMDDHLLLTKVLAPYFSEGSSPNQQRQNLSDELLSLLRSRMMDLNGWGSQEEAKRAYSQFLLLSPNQQRAVAALSLAELFARLSSSEFSGTHDNSPPAWRKLAWHFLTDVERFWLELADSFGKSYHQYSKAHYDEQQKKIVYENTVQEIDTLKHWQDTLCPQVGILTGYADCTALLSSEMRVTMNKPGYIDNKIWEMMKLF